MGYHSGLKSQQRVFGSTEDQNPVNTRFPVFLLNCIKDVNRHKQQRCLAALYQCPSEMWGYFLLSSLPRIEKSVAAHDPCVSLLLSGLWEPYMLEGREVEEKEEEEGEKETLWIENVNMPFNTSVKCSQAMSNCSSSSQPQSTVYRPDQQASEWGLWI